MQRQQQLQMQMHEVANLQQQAMGREELEDLIASKAAMRIAAALDAGGGVARLGYEDSEGAELVMGGSKAAQSSRDFVVGMAETMLSNLDALLSDHDDDEEEGQQEREEQPATSKGDYALEQQRKYYAYYSIYGDDGDEEDIYDTYYESYLDPYAEAPDALDMLASLAELIAWSSHTGSLVLHLFPIGGIVNGGRSASVVAPQLQEPQQLSPAQLQLMQLQRLREQSDAAEVAQGRGALLFAGQPYDPAAATASADPFMLLLNGEEGESASAGTLIISDLNLAWFNDDGSLNWGLVTLLILTAGTLAMLAGAGSEGGECDSLDNPLLLLPEDCYGAEPLKIECASTYVPPVLPNESVAKVLCK
eukprot:XP_001702704.1 predicted protein [Chlamydomonas reinhardtii]